MKTVIGWIIALMLIGTGLGLAGNALGWFSAWVQQPAKIYSVENVRAQWAFAYTYEESLRTAARNVCSVRQLIDTNPNLTENEASQRRTQLMTLEQNYNRIQAAYDAKLRNAFEARLVKPTDVIGLAYSLEDQITTLQNTEKIKCGLVR
jgi:hypothetical protein